MHDIKQKKKPHVVIVGAGFGGVYTARHLEPLVEKGLIDVTLVSRNNYFLFTPLLHEVATGGLSALSVAEPINYIFRGTTVRFHHSEVTAIDLARRIVTAKTGELAYDYLVLSTGAETNFYNVPGAKENSLVLKDLGSAIDVRNRIIEFSEKASEASDPATKQKLLSFVVVGGGATGVETAAEIKEFMDHANVTLVSTSPELLPHFDPRLQAIAKKVLIKKGVTLKMGVPVTSVTPDSVVLGDGTSLPASCVLWVAGVKPSTLEIEGLEYHPSGRVAVDPYLRATKRQEVFVLGDVSAFIEEDTKAPAPMHAQIAVEQASVVAANIQALLTHKPLRPFAYKMKGVLVSLGQWNAAGILWGVVISGAFTWWLWRTVYLFKFHSWRKRIKIVVEWTINIVYSRDSTKIR